jgi:membrane protein
MPALIDPPALRARFEQTLPGRLVDRTLDLNPIERALALGSKLFTAVIPLSIILGGVLSTPDAVAERVIEGFGLTGAGANALRRLLDVPTGDTRATINIVGVLVLAYSMLSFAHALQRVYENAWRLPTLRTRGFLWGGVWVVAFTTYFSLSTPLTHVLHAHGLHIGATLVTLISGSVLWMFTPFILLGRRVRPRALVPGGVATAILLTAFNLGSRVYLPESTTTNVQRYGLVGVTFTILTWLFAFSLMLIVSAASGAVLAERRFGWTPDQARTAPDADISDR